jgi:hypothetical protein
MIVEVDNKGPAVGYLDHECLCSTTLNSTDNTICFSVDCMLRACRCLNLSTSIGGARSKVEGEDRHDLEPEGMREDTRHKIYTGSGSRSSYPTSCLG